MKTQLKQAIKFTVIFTIIFISNICYAQQTFTWEDFMERFHNIDNEGYYDEQLLNDLLEVHNNKININTASEDDLAVLPFLSTSQIRDIIYYRTVNGQMLTLGELMFITSLDKETRDYLNLFIYAGEPKRNNISLKQLINNSRNELTIRTDIPLYKQAGYKSSTDNNEQPKYAGSPLYESARYKFSSMNHLDAGFALEKDPGEKGIDHYTGYVMLKDIGSIKNLTIGNYRANFGHGLVINNGYSFGKTMSTNNVDRLGKGFSKLSSMSESGFMTGAAMSINHRNLAFSVFASHKKDDGTINSDSTGITSLKTDGLHRTNLERSKKGNIGTTDLGGNILWDAGTLQLSATIAYTHFEIPLKPKQNTAASLYRKYNAQGTDFCSYGLSYVYRLRKLLFSGETATGNKGGVASFNTIKWSPNSYNSFNFIQRFYSYKYVSINGKCFGENAVPQNEQGFYIGWDTKPSRKFSISSYIDCFYFPWLKYQVSNSSYGFDGMVQLNYSLKKNIDFTVRYKVKSKQKDYTIRESKKDTLKVLQYNSNHSLRLTCSYSLNQSISMRTSINGTMIDFGPSPNEFGISVSQALQHTSKSGKNKVNISATYFNTDTYNARIYGYEPSILYSFGMKSYYYKGIRLAGLISAMPIRNLTATGKIGFTYYFNRSTIGTGYDIIDSNHKEDIQLQLRWKF